MNFAKHLLRLIYCCFLCAAALPSLKAQQKRVTLQEIVSDRLCHNTLRVMKRQGALTTKCVDEFSEPITCDTRPPHRNDSSKCLEAHFIDLTSPLQPVRKYLIDYAANIAVKRMKITLHVTRQNIHSIGAMIDAFLTPRPWWKVIVEPYPWILHSKIRGGHPERMFTLVLEREYESFEPYLRYIATVQFPSDLKCRQTPMLLGFRTMVHPGLGGVLDMYNFGHLELPYAIFQMYVSISNAANDSAAFVTGSSCPDQRNKWLCVFLPVSNCTIPSLISSCTEPNCVQDTERYPSIVYMSRLFESASENATLVVDKSSELYDRAKNQLKMLQQQEESHEKLLNEQGVRPPITTPMRQKPALAHAVPPASENTTQRYILATQFKASASGALFKQFLMRRNFYFRSMVAHAIKEVRMQYQFSEKERCIAVHLRRGDRTVNDEKSAPSEIESDIIEYCHQNANHTADILDYGCYSVPFQAVKLRHVIDMAGILIGADRLPSFRFVISTDDDGTWFEQQLTQLEEDPPELMKSVDSKLYRRKFVHFIPPATTEQHQSSDRESFAYHYARSEGGTLSGVLLHGSIALMQQCEAFIGHFDSQFTGYIYQALCLQHGAGQGICPPTYDMRDYTPLQTHLSINGGGR